MKKGNSGTYFILAGAMLFSKLIGMLRDILLANFYGVSADAVSFAAASKIPLILFDVSLGTAVAGAFIPMLNTYLAKEDMEKARGFASKFIGAVFLFAGIISAFGLLFPSAFISIIAPGLDEVAFSKACSLLVIMSPITLLAALSYTFVAILQSLDRFILPALISVLSNATVIVYFFTLNDRYGIYGLAAALTIGWVLQLVFMLIPLMKTGFKIRVSFNLKDDDLKKTVILTLPVLLSSWVTPLNTLIITNFASSIAEGAAIPMLDYAYKLYFVAAGIFSFALTNLYFPKLSRSFSVGDKLGAVNILKSMLSGISYIVFPISALLMALSGPIIRTMYMRGEFGLSSAGTVAVLLAIYSSGILFLSFQEILNKYFYSMKNTTTPLLAAVLGVFTNLVCGYFLAKIWGIYGLAVATTISTALMAIVLLTCAFLKDRRLWDKKTALLISGYALSFAVSFFVAKYVSGIFENDIISVLAGGGAGLLAYLASAVLLKAKSIKQLFEI